MTASLLSVQVSVFNGVHSTAAVEQIPLATMLARIKDGAYAARIQALRQFRTRDERLYKKQKTHLIAFTPGCALHTRAQKVAWKEKLIAPTHIVHLDVDHVDAAALKTQVSADPTVVFAFVSPSGEGLKLGIASAGITDTTSYSQVWRATITAWKGRFPDAVFKEDEHVKFLHALCFVSYDPNLYANAAAVPFVVTRLSPRHQRKTTPAYQSNDAQTEYARVSAALAHIPNNDADYDTWLMLGMALHSTNESWGRDLWDDWSQRSQKYDARKQAQSWRSFTTDGAVTMGSLFHLAQQHGYVPPREPPASRSWRRYPATVTVRVG